MRNSAWYHKLWRSKLDELPLHSDAASAWKGMKSVLDKSMPAGNAATAAPAVKSLVAKIISATFYVLPAAAMIFTAVHYFGVPEKPARSTTHSGKSSQKYSAKDAQTSSPDSVLQDSLAQQSDSLSGDSSSAQLEKGMPQITQRRSNESGFAVRQKKGAANPTVIHYNSSATTGIANHKTRSTTITAHPRGENNSGLGNKGDKVAQGQNIDVRYRDAHQLPVNPVQSSGSTYGTESALQAILNQRVKAHLPTVITRPGNSTGRVLTAKERKLKEEQLKIADKQLKKLNEKEARLKDKQAKNAKRKAENTASKNKARGKKPKVRKSEVPKEKKDIITPDYTYGINAGMNVNGKSLYLGGFGSYALSKRWMIGGGLTLNSSRSISGEYSHESYYKPDSLPAFKIIDSRKVMVLDLPLYAIYKISGRISVKGGPVIGLAFKQHAVSSTITTLADTRDTLYHSKQIDTALRNTVLPKLNIGFKAGVSFQFGQFDLEGTYQIHSPYKVKSDLGGYHKSFQTFSIGIGYRFK